MKVYYETTDFELRHTAVTLGKLDGLHLGHQSLIKEIREAGRSLGSETVLFSFDTSVINGQRAITTKAERVTLCEEYGIDHVIFYPVSKETMLMEPEEFIREVLVKRLGAVFLVTGEDFRFGKDRRGDVAMLQHYAKQYGYQMVVRESIRRQGVKVGSTGIKECLQAGQIGLANELLGYPYFVMGEVVRGNQIGRTMEVRTVNLLAEESKFLPCNGVDQTSVRTGDGEYRGITNIWYSPTVRSDREITEETHLFGFDQELYGKTIKVIFERFIRPEKKFNSLNDLKKQIALDISEVNL